MSEVPPSERESGVYRGKSVARVFESPDGLVVLVGKAARDNDIVTFKLSRPDDFWLHVAGQPGSHVLVINPGGLDKLPRETQRYAAGLAAGYSSARSGGTVAVHLARIRDVGKARGAPAGEVQLRRYDTIKAKPTRE